MAGGGELVDHRGEASEGVHHQQFGVVPDVGDVGYFQQPVPETPRQIVGHLVVLADMRGVGVVAGMRIAPVIGFLQIDERAEIQHQFVELSGPEGGSVGGLVAERICGDRKDGAMGDHRRDHPPSAE